MKLSPHDLRQLDDERLRQLREQNPEGLERLSIQLLADLKEALERLDQSPSNSSRPPSSRDPWFKADHEAGSTEEDRRASENSAKASASDRDDTDPPCEHRGSHAKKSAKARKPGKQKGAPGVARMQTMSITDTQRHVPTHCTLCGAPLPEQRASCYTAYEVLDLELGELSRPSVRLTNTRQEYYETRCRCGHLTREEPKRAPPNEAGWGGAGLTEWRLIGPGLAAFLSWLHFRMRSSARLCREFLLELFGLSLSVGVIQQSFHETARAAEPIYEQLIEELRHAEAIYADETPHKQAGEPLWLWTVLSLGTVIFFIGRRSKESFHAVIGPRFAGWLMSDGYGVYREYTSRLRCWAHLIRKARGLADSYTPHVQGYGVTLLALFDDLILAVHQARASPDRPLQQTLAGKLKRLRELSEKMARSQNEKARKLGVEFLNDWAAIFRVLDHPELPLTNNIAERALRHWVILRRITFGTRTEAGSRTLAISASLIETCRLRNISPVRYLQQVVTARRAGLDAPPLPQPAGEAA